MAARWNRRVTVLVFMLLLSCGGAARVVRGNDTVVAPSGSILLDRDAVDLCPDEDGLLVLEASGTRVLRLSGSPAVVETIPLSLRLSSPRGIRSDRYSLYLYDDNTLYRALRSSLTQLAWVNNISVAGFVVYALGEALISDAERGVVWHKQFFGESREFFGPGDVLRPGPLAEFKSGHFVLLAGRGRLCTFNRAGIISEVRECPVECDGVVAGDAGVLYLFERGGSAVWVVSRADIVKYVLAGIDSLQSIAVLRGRLHVLDRGGRILIYSLPEA